MSKKDVHYTYIAYKNHLQIYLEKPKYKTKKYEHPNS